MPPKRAAYHDDVAADPGGDQRWRPSREQIAAAEGRTVPDVIAPGLDVLFVGINPGLYSGAVGHHFARPGNRFWKVLHEAGFTPRVLSPFDEDELPEHGLGVTNLVERATATAAQLSDDELRAGARTVRTKAERFGPRCAAFLGISTYRVAFGVRDAGMGEQDGRLGPSRVWVLPNPSGLNAHYQLPQLSEAYAELRRAVERA
jgi:TDG/mug DNA glycosylase family protein